MLEMKIPPAPDRTKHVNPTVCQDQKSSTIAKLKNIVVPSLRIQYYVMIDPFFAGNRVVDPHGRLASTTI